MEIPADLAMEVMRLFSQMDQAYTQAARQSGFECRGCDDNCCRSLFYHHTLVELLYLRSGLADLPSSVQARIKERADRVRRESDGPEHGGQSARVMCPLNERGRCGLYAHRPMICRLHGIPHGLRRPDGRMTSGPGCDDYYTQCGRTEQARLDRTPLYTAMAALESRLRSRLGFSRKIKLTVAEMILNEIY